MSRLKLLNRLRSNDSSDDDTNKFNQADATTSLDEKVEEFWKDEAFLLKILAIVAIIEVIKPFGFSILSRLQAVPIELQAAVVFTLAGYVIVFYIKGSDIVMRLLYKPVIEPLLEIVNAEEGRYMIHFAHREYWMDKVKTLGANSLKKIDLGGGIRGLLARSYDPVDKVAEATWRKLNDPGQVEENQNAIEQNERIMDEHLKEARETNLNKTIYKVKADDRAMKKAINKLDRIKSDGRLEELLQDATEEYTPVTNEEGQMKEEIADRVIEEAKNELEQEMSEGADEMSADNDE